MMLQPTHQAVVVRNGRVISVCRKGRLLLAIHYYQGAWWYVTHKYDDRFHLLPRGWHVVEIKRGTTGGSAAKDGPATFGGTAECVNCNARRSSDMFWFEGRILCGDCRYKERHGRWPSYVHGSGSYMSNKTYESESKYHGGFGSETLNRQIKLDAVTPEHAEFLDNWLSDSKLSLD